MYISQNPLLHDPHGSGKSGSSRASFIEYYPIEQSVQWMQWQLWGMRYLGLPSHQRHVCISSAHFWSGGYWASSDCSWRGWRIDLRHSSRDGRIGGMDFGTQEHAFAAAVSAGDVRVDRLSKTRRRTRDYWLALAFLPGRDALQNHHGAIPLVILLYAWWKRGRIRLVMT